MTIEDRTACIFKILKENERRKSIAYEARRIIIYNLHVEIGTYKKRTTTVFTVQIPMFVIGPLNQCLALRIQEERMSSRRPPTATGV